MIQLLMEIKSAGLLFSKVMNASTGTHKDTKIKK